MSQYVVEFGILSSQDCDKMCLQGHNFMKILDQDEMLHHWLVQIYSIFSKTDSHGFRFRHLKIQLQVVRSSPLQFSTFMHNSEHESRQIKNETLPTSLWLQKTYYSSSFWEMFFLPPQFRQVDSWFVLQMILPVLSQHLYAQNSGFDSCYSVR